MSAISSDFLETKRRPNGRVSEYRCTLLAYNGSFAAVRWVYEQDFESQGHRFLKGGHTDAWYWRRRRYLLYRIYAPDGRHVGDRFDVIDGVQMTNRSVSYRDLYLDIWIDPVLGPHLEDEDELNEAVEAGILTPEEAASTWRTARLLVRDHARIVDAAQQSLDALMSAASGRR